MARLVELRRPRQRGPRQARDRPRGAADGRQAAPGDLRLRPRGAGRTCEALAKLAQRPGQGVSPHDGERGVSRTSLLRTARGYDGRTGQGTVAALRGAFHGRTLGAQVAGGIPALKSRIVNLPEAPVQVLFPDGFRTADTRFAVFEETLERARRQAGAGRRRHLRDVSGNRPQFLLAASRPGPGGVVPETRRAAHHGRGAAGPGADREDVRLPALRDHA